MKNNLRKHVILIFILLIFSLFVIQSFSAFPLPEPEMSEMILEQAISRRASVRSWTTINITESELSTVLWAALGYSRKNPEERTSRSLDGNHSFVIFVVNSSATYRYHPKNHSLVWWNSNTKMDMISAGCWTGNNPTYLPGASAILIMVWNKTDSDNFVFNHFKVGCMIQNVYLTANSIGLGTVSQSEIDKDEMRNSLGLPTDYEPLITMPLGYPKDDYPAAGPYTENMTNNLPEVIFSEVELGTAVNELLTVTEWSTATLSLQEISQLLWAAYGCLNTSHASGTQHRTVPSAFNSYPMKIYALNASGVYLYDPGNHNLSRTMEEDKRFEVADAAAGATWAAQAPLIFVIVYDEAQGPRPEYRLIEAGLISQELYLAARAWNLGTSAIGTGFEEYDGVGASEIRAILGLPESEVPLFIQPVGHLSGIEIETVIVREIDGVEPILSTNPWTEYYVNASITAQEPFLHLLNVTWTFNCTGTLEDASDNVRNHYTFKWTPSEGFSEPILTQHLIQQDCSNASLSSSSGWFRLAFRFGKSANATAWSCTVTAYGADYSARKTSSPWIMNTYISFTLSSNTVSWDMIYPQSVNISANSMPLNITISSNKDVKIRIRGDGDLTNGGTLPLSNVYIGQSDTSTNNDGIKLTTSYQDWKTGIPFSEEASHTSYWFLTVPTGTPADTYSFIFYIEVSLDN